MVCLVDPLFQPDGVSSSMNEFVRYKVTNLVKLKVVKLYSRSVVKMLRISGVMGNQGGSLRSRWLRT